MSAANKAIVQRLYQEVWNERKLDVIKAIISPSHALQSPNISCSSIGPEAYKRNFLAFLALFPDLRLTIEATISVKYKVTACWTISGTHKRDYMGVPAT